MSMQLEFSVNKQIITRIDENKVVEKSKNYLYCKFNFSNEWEEIIKTAIFTSAKGEIFNVILEEDACLIPFEVIEYPHFTVSVFGGDLITANKVVVSMIKSGYASGKTPSKPTPDVYQQILNSVKTPYIGENGNWYIWDIEKKVFVDSGYKSQGDTPEKGVDYWTPTDKAEITEYVDEQTKVIKSDVEGLQKQINEEAHFRGYLSTNAEIQELKATPNDFVYSAESGTVWVYDTVNGWHDTGVLVPDQLTPASDTKPLINGEASAGTENAYARGDHRHPTDTTRASVAALNAKADKSEIPTQVSQLNNDAKYLSEHMVVYGYGLQILADGCIAIARCSKSEIDARTNSTHPVTPDVLEYAVKSVGDGYYAKEPIAIITEAIALGVDFLTYNNHIIRCGTLHAISFTFGNGEYADDYALELSFDSGATPTTISYSASGIINWVGTDCSTVDGLSIFQPSANTHYDIVFYYNGNQFIGLVNGYVPASGNVVSE